MAIAAVIGGTGLCDWAGADVLDQHVLDTPYGSPSANILRLGYRGAEFLFLARHGQPHRLPPHKINYRANLWALEKLGVSDVLAVNAVGGIGADYAAGCIAIPDQIIDYSYGRDHSFYDGSDGRLEHVDFTFPYDQGLRERMLSAGGRLGIGLQDGGVYAATQGPRLETAAEVQRLQRDGCHLIGMTGMPEAALARELGLRYAAVCLVVNPAAGQSDLLITMEDIQAVIASGMGRIQQLLAATLMALQD